ncbi:MAG: beta-ketoacyl-[acyl-carrier-protein] synthase family protein [Nitrosomonadales bacterium]|nr:beta-ketoacyl-[acyl-carrier-protein] synthase family protein [Nitrosomonadales bacterium]
MEIRRVVVTGIGIVSPLGHDPKAFFENLANAKSGVRRIDDRFDAALDSPVAATVEGFDPTTHFSKNRLLSLDRASQFALVAARQALEDAQLEPAQIGADRVGVSVGTGMGGAGTLDSAYHEIYVRGMNRVRPLTLVAAMHNAAAANLSIEFGLQGASFTHSSACASSAIAIGEAVRHIRHGYADAMLAGGAESLLTLGVIRAWEALRTLANMDGQYPETSCRPFAADRSGFVIGEGAGFVVLEELSAALRRGAVPYAEVCGYGANSDAHHLTQPNAEGQAAAIRQALADATMEPDEIDYINAHGTATVAGDASETSAIKAVFGERAQRLPVSSTKSMHGHLLGAAGAVEFIAALLAMKHETLPPTAHLQIADPACDLDYVPLRARPAPGICAVMSNSFAFGGSNAVLIARRLTH